MKTVALVVLLHWSVDLAELESLLRAGLLTPEQAVALYCATESTGKQHDAFCACPEDAVQQLYEQLGQTPSS